MKRLVFVVEGDTEIIWIEKFVIPYLYGKGFKNPMHTQTIITNRKLHKKGGNVNYEYLKNDLNNIFSQGNVLVTTFLDFFRLPNTFPGFTTDSLRIDEIEHELCVEFGNDPCFFPYIQRHEIEALMFSGIEGFDFVVDSPKQLEKLQQIIDANPNPEDINGGATTAPSKRLEDIFGYDKITDGELILEMLGIEKVISKCPRFAEWLFKIEDILTQSNR